MGKTPDAQPDVVFKLWNYTWIYYVHSSVNIFHKQKSLVDSYNDSGGHKPIASRSSFRNN